MDEENNINNGELLIRAKFFEQKELWRKYLAEEINKDLENYLCSLNSDVEKQIIKNAIEIVKGQRV